jgi:hypothetical protein
MFLTVLLLSTILDQASQNAEAFWRQVSAIECTEQIAQTRLSADRKIAAYRASTFDYVVTLKASGPTLLVDESRIPQKSTNSPESLLLTSGFPMLMLIFHPDFRDRFEFDVNEAKGKIAFRAKAGSRSFSAIKIDGRLYPIHWEGRAWINPANGAVRRIEASASMSDIDIDEMHVVVEYGSVPLNGAPIPYWLPLHATISLRSPQRQWKNIHEFRSYKLFSVTSTTTPAAANEPFE